MVAKDYKRIFHDRRPQSRGFGNFEDMHITDSSLLIDGRALAASLRDDVLQASKRLNGRGVEPCLAIVLVGDDPASAAYASSLEKEGSRCGVTVVRSTLPALAQAVEVRLEMQRLGRMPHVHGVILQQPMPPHLLIENVVDAMPVDKDVDGTSPTSLGRLGGHLGNGFVPATPLAVLLLLQKTQVWPLRGRRVTVIGKSGVVGLPVSLLLMQENATVTVTHKETRDLAYHVRSAEVVVSAAGVPGLITGDMLQPGAVVIDVGTTFVNGVLRGDVDFESAQGIASEITPVPGGVGPVTNVALMRNVLYAARNLKGS
jgi:methylenetetrahydrofolate dehydrogenase (NADP+)/methenyltetrahydrofolate cyclohydrolase